MPADRQTWAACRQAYEAGAATVTDIALQIGVTHQAVSKRARKEQWRAPGAIVDRRPLDRLPPIPSTVATAATPAAVVNAAAEAATETQGRRSLADVDWSQQAAVEAAAAGLTAAALRQRLILELRDNRMQDPVTGEVRTRLADYRMIRSLGETYKVFIQAAQLLTGDATERVAPSLDPEDRRARLLTVLQSIATRRAEAIEATATDDPDEDADDDPAEP